MKITSTQYAKTLYDLTKDKNHKGIDGVVSEFSGIIRKNGDIRKMKEIAKKFEEIYNRENGIIEAEVVSRDHLHSELKKKLKNFLKEKYQVKEVVINNIIDEAVKGGVIIRIGDEVMDSSVERQLRELKNILVK